MYSVSSQCANILNNDIIWTMNLTSLNGTDYGLNLAFNTRAMKV